MNISKLFLTLSCLFASASAFAGSITCGNSKVNLSIVQVVARDGASTDTSIEMSYVDFKGVLRGTFNSKDPSFQFDQEGYRQIYLNGANEDQEFFTGKYMLDAVNGLLTLDGRIQLDGGQPLPVHGTYICSPPTP